MRIAMLLLGFLIASSAQAQVASIIIKELDPLPGAPEGQTVAGISNTAVNHGPSYAATINSAGDAGTLSHVWGNATGGPGTVLRTEETIGIYRQDNFESFFGISTVPFEVAYSPSCTDTVSGTSGLDGVWFGDLAVAVEEQPYPHLVGWYWSFGSRPAATADGHPTWVGGITDTPGGSTQNRGLFFGIAATPLLMGDAYVGGLPDPLSRSSTVSFDYRFSALGTHYLAEVQTETGSSTNDNHMVSDNHVVMAGGAPVSEAGAIPVEIGGLAGEAWDNFDFVGITESGEWMFTGDTNAATDVDEIIVRNGSIIHREGDVLDGETLSGAIEGAYMNENGDLAFIWDIVTEGGTSETLFFNGRLLLTEGDYVDVDGDFVADSNAVLDAFTGISSLTLSDRDAEGWVRIYFTADVDISVATPRLGQPLVAGGEEAGMEAGTELQPAGDPLRTVSEGYMVMRVNAGTSAVEPVAGAVHHLGIHPSVVTDAGARIRFDLPRTGSIEVGIYDLSGRLVRNLASGTRAAGGHTVRWDGRSASGEVLPAGVYLLRCCSDAGTDSRRVTLVH